MPSPAVLKKILAGLAEFGATSGRGHDARTSERRILARFLGFLPVDVAQAMAYHGFDGTPESFDDVLMADGYRGSDSLVGTPFIGGST